MDKLCNLENVDPASPVVEDKDIEALQNQGLSPPEIGARLNVSPQFIRSRLKRAGLKPHPHPVWGEAKERRSDIVSLHEEGYTPKQIAEKLGLAWTTVHKHLQKARLTPHPSAEEVKRTQEGQDEIARLAKEDVPRYQIAKRTGSTWTLVAEALERSSAKPVWPACEELGAWASSLLPIVDEMRKATPDTGAIIRKVEQLEKELVAIGDATRTVENRLPFKEKKADEERWCVADISEAVTNSLDYIQLLKGCVKQLDLVKLPKLLEQAETCIRNICSVVSGAIFHATEKPSLLREEVAQFPEIIKPPVPILAPRINIEEMMFANSAYQRITNLDTEEVTIKQVY